nr:MAG TPA: hypothetical protein [Caudoviricetes sp.]
MFCGFFLYTITSTTETPHSTRNSPTTPHNNHTKHITPLNIPAFYSYTAININSNYYYLKPPLLLYISLSIINKPF